jgi:hypothetical protein
VQAVVNNYVFCHQSFPGRPLFIHHSLVALPIVEDHEFQHFGLHTITRFIRVVDLSAIVAPKRGFYRFRQRCLGLAAPGSLQWSRLKL